MFKNVNKPKTYICVDLEEPLTGHACTQVVLEIVKYILYQKQQIPLSCDTLIKLHANSKQTDRNYSAMQNLVNTLCNVSEQLTSQFNLEGCDVKEIVIVIGATIVSPKLCINLELPSYLLSNDIHLEYQHSHRKSLLNVMKSMLECMEFQNEMTTPLGPTNTFLLVNKKDPRKISEFFIPKPHYIPSAHNTSFFHIRLNYNKNSQLACSCENVIKVHQDSPNGHYIEDNYISENSNISDYKVPYQWYQSREVFKGFKFLR